MQFLLYPKTLLEMTPTWFCLSNLSSLTRVVVTIILLWIIWRYWRFSIAHDLDPKIPKRLPYVIPFIGHLVRMSRDSHAVFAMGRKFFKDTDDIFTITVFGQDYYIVSRPSDILAVFREPSKLDFNTIARDYMASAGMTTLNNNLLFNCEGMIKQAMDGLHDNIKLQLHPGEKLESMQGKMLQCLEHSMHLHRICNQAVIYSTAETKTVSLWHWCGRVLVEASLTSFYGRSVHTIWPDAIDTTLRFEKEAWKLDAGYPRFLAPRMHQVKENGQKAFARYAALPWEEKTDACWFMRCLDKDVAAAGIADQTQRSILFWTMNRVINANTFKHCFWSLAYLLHNEVLQARLIHEIQPAFTANGELSVSYLNQSCPLLASFCDEVLRLTVAPIGVRRVLEQCEIGGKTLQPQGIVLMPYRQGHFDPAVVGSDPTAFDADRFVKYKDIRRSPAWRPFGGGTSYCPGRYVTRSEIYIFLALVLDRFDLVLEAGTSGLRQKFPVIDESIPAGGILPPIQGDDLLVRISSRKKS
ncbi:cytochrome P450 [Nemania sp. FL0916]|nr:cytochrome P450 [Nemania sp. FL0916]